MTSKHPNAGLLIRRGLYDNLHSFAELEQRISALGDENSKAVGDAFEVFVEGYLATHQKLQAEAIWLVGQVPQGIRQQMNLPNDAKGIDGIFRTRTGVLVPYQVKFRSQRAYLTYTQIAPFLGLTERATDRIVFTNSNELSEDVKNRDAMRTVRGIDFDDLTQDELGAISAWLREQPVEIKKPVPDEYQNEALAKIRQTLAKSDRAHCLLNVWITPESGRRADIGGCRKKVPIALILPCPRRVRFLPIRDHNVDPNGGEYRWLNIKSASTMGLPTSGIWEAGVGSRARCS